MAVIDTCNNGWREPRSSAAPAGSPNDPEAHHAGWGDADAIGIELESWLEAFTGPRRRPDELVDLVEPPAVVSTDTPNNWREPLDEVGGDTQA